MSLTVPQLLTEARAHERARIAAANKRNGKLPAPDYPSANQHAQSALDKRRQAHESDPDHLDPAWQGDRLPHDAQVAWLEAYIARP